MIIKLITKIYDILFPVFCFGCGKEKNYLCENCRKKILPPLPLEIPGLKIVYSACLYKNPPIKKAMWYFKYRGVYKLSENFSELAIQNISYFSTINKKNHILVPIPVSKKKMKLRGYNQSELLAETLSAKLNIPIRKNFLRKKFHTGSQMETKSVSQRKLNLKNSFEVFKDKNLTLPDKKSVIILIDDIITTGETLKEAAKTLKKAGFKNIVGITIAKG